MAAYKLEDNIREKLEAREIKPSADSWGKLDAKLECERSKKKVVGWYFMAASFVGILILASVFFTQDNEQQNVQIVKENMEHQNQEKHPEILPNNSKEEEIVSTKKDSEEGEVLENKEKRKANSDALKPLPQKKSEIDKKVDRTEVSSNVKHTERQQILEDSSHKSEAERVLSNKVDEVVASVRGLQNNNTEVTAKEVEELLNNAHRDIQTQQILKSPKVDATALLQNVEWELEKSFRDKVFDALGEGFQKIRTAVIERND